LSSAGIARRKELGEFLRRCRGRRRPEAAGLVAGPRRRTPGLRREEVAQLAGVGPTWYTWLEQGRQITVSPATLDAIVRALDLSRAEREHVYRLADLAPEPSSPVVELPPVLRAVLTQLQPYLAGAYTAAYDLLGWNSTYAACFPRLVAAPAGRRNLLRYLASLDDGELAGHETLVRAVIGRFRASWSAHLGDPHWQGLIDEVVLADARLRAVWEEQRVNDPLPESRDLITTPVGRIEFRTTSLRYAADLDLYVVIGVPAEDGDVTSVRELLSQADVADGYR
jgi:transcriptional regulator with XRE-family HTH domain